jgi:tricorn protease
VRGQVLEPSTDLDRVLTGAVGQDVRVALAAEGGQTREITLKAVAGGALARGLFEQWRARSEKRVKEVAKGRIGYVHLSQMDPENLTRFQQAVTRFNANKSIQGMILDVRENGGGNIHVQLMAILQARPYVRMQPRGLPKLTQPQLYWDKPVVVLVNERSFSDAEVFPWSFRAAGLGTTVGMPTPGGVIGTQDVKLSDGSTFRIPRVGWYSLEGKNLEANGFVPDLLVPETSEDRLAGRDPQLDKALEVIQQQVTERFGAAPATSPSGAGAPTTPAPEGETPGAQAALALNPLADAEVGEWVRYRAEEGDGEPTLVRYTVTSVAGGRVTLQREIESGTATLPVLPEILDVAPLSALLPALGEVGSSSAVTVQVGGSSAEGVQVGLRLGERDLTLLFTNAVPALGLLHVEQGGRVLMHAVEWGRAAPPKAGAAPDPGAPAGAAASPAPAPAAPVPAAPAPAPEPARPDAAGDAEEGGAGGVSIDNPLADAKAGEWIRLRQTGRGGVSVVRMEVAEVTEQEVVLSSVVEEGSLPAPQAPLRRPREARLMVGRGRPAEQVKVETTTLEVAGRTLPCVAVTVPGRRGGPPTTTWYSQEVPVTGLVRRTRGEEVVIEVLAWGTKPAADAGR